MAQKAIADFCLVTDYVANGSFASLKQNVTYLTGDGYAILVRLTDFRNEWSGDFVFVSKSSFDFLKKSSLRAGDLIVSNVGARLGSVFVVPELGTPMTLGPNSVLIRPESQISLVPYLYHYLTSKEGQRAIWRIATTTAQPKFNKTELRKLQIPLPPLAEQKRIAGILDAADALRAKRRESLAQLDTLLQSTFLDMFGDPVTNPMGWEVKPLSTFIDTIIDYRGKTPPKSEEGIPLLSAANVKQGRIDLSHKQFISPEVYAEWTTRGFTQPGDVLITTEAPVGEVAPYPKHGIFQISRRVMALRPNKHLLPEVLLHVMLAPTWHRRLCRLTRGSTVPRVLKPSITGQLVPVLPGDRQRCFAAIVESVEQQKTSQRAHLGELDTLFGALQQRAFSGDL